MFFSMEAAQASACPEERGVFADLPPSDRRYFLELVAVPLVAGAPPVGTVWEIPVGSLFTLELPTYRTEEGLEGYQFAFTMTRDITLPGDFDHDGDQDLDDFNAFEQCFTGPGVPPAPDCEPGDFDGDGDIDCLDWDQFVLAWTEPGDPPTLPRCDITIPTVSDWGFFVMTLLLLRLLLS